MSVDWQPAMSVGVEEIDAHHRQVLRRLRHLSKAVAQGGVAPIRTALRSFGPLLAEHQAIEEAWMEEQGYPGAGEHARAHGAMRERIGQARVDDVPGAEARLAEVAASLAQALDEHMRSDDLKLGRFWTARQNLRRLAENGPGVGMNLTPLPGTLAPVTPLPGHLARAAPLPDEGRPRSAEHRTARGADQLPAPADPRTMK